MLQARCDCGAIVYRKQLRRPPKCGDCKRKVHRECNRRWWAKHPGLSKQYYRDRKLARA